MELYFVIVIKRAAFFQLLFVPYKQWHSHFKGQFFFQFFSLCFAGVIVVSDLNKNIGGSTEKKAQIGRFAYPYPLPSTLDQVSVREDNIYLLV